MKDDAASIAPVDPNIQTLAQIWLVVLVYQVSMVRLSLVARVGPIGSAE